MASKTFAVATTVGDPMTAQRLVEVLQEAGYDAFARAGGAASTDGFAAATGGFWDIFVPTDAATAATLLIVDELAAIERDGAANAAAAEEEALSGETPTAE
jgi:hypothetical protein